MAPFHLAPDPFFLLLFRLMKGDRFQTAGSQKKVLGFITSLCWFVAKPGRGTAKACEKIWSKCSVSQESFWSGETLRLAVGYDARDSAFLLIPPCPPGDLDRLFNKLRNDPLEWNELGEIENVTAFFKSQRFQRFYQQFSEFAGKEGEGEDDDIAPGTIPKQAMVAFVDQLRESERQRQHPFVRLF